LFLFFLLSRKAKESPDFCFVFVLHVCFEKIFVPREDYRQIKIHERERGRWNFIDVFSSLAGMSS